MLIALKVRKKPLIFNDKVGADGAAPGRGHLSCVHRRRAWFRRGTESGVGETGKARAAKRRRIESAARGEARPIYCAESIWRKARVTAIQAPSQPNSVVKPSIAPISTSVGGARL